MLINDETNLETPGAIWFCRHGNRLDFVEPEWSGDDPPLSADGVIQAKETALRLKGEGINQIFASPFLRTVETAHHIATELGLEIKIEYGVAEWFNPEWFSQTPKLIPLTVLKKQFPGVDTSYESFLSPQYPETMDIAKARCGDAVKKIKDKYKENFLVVGHGLSLVSMSQAPSKA